MSTGLADDSLEEVTPSVTLLSPDLVWLGDLCAFAGVLLGDLVVAVVLAVSPVDGFLLSWRPMVNFSC